MTECPRAMIAAPFSRAGKTTIALAVMRALTLRGLRVKPYKSGPNYVDIVYHEHATGCVGNNLDSFLMSAEAMNGLLAHNAGGVDISIVEGFAGLFDGIGTSTDASSAQIARLTETPIILVLPSHRLGVSAAALVHGYTTFRKGVTIAGVILDSITGKEHYTKVKESIEDFTGVPVIGYLEHADEVSLPATMLELTPIERLPMVEKSIAAAAALAAETIDLDRFISIAQSALAISSTYDLTPDPEPRVTIAIARDECFSFYYDSSLKLLEHLGAKLAPFSPLHDEAIPEGTSGVYLGAGYFDIYAEQLSQNGSMRQALLDASMAGMPIYGECGGYAYLMKDVELTDGRTLPLVGVFSGTSQLGLDSVRRYGYVQVRTMYDTFLCPSLTQYNAHEFHHSQIENEGAIHLVQRAEGPGGWTTGDTVRNTVGTYAHVNFITLPVMAENFIAAAAEYGEKDGAVR